MPGKLKSAHWGVTIDNSYTGAMDRAKQLLLEDTMYKTDILLSQGKLKNLNIETQDGLKRTVHLTTGHFGKEGVSGLYGISALPVLSLSSKLSELIISGAHYGSNAKLNNKSPWDALARSRSTAYIHK